MFENGLEKSSLMCCILHSPSSNCLVRPPESPGRCSALRGRRNEQRRDKEKGKCRRRATRNSSCTPHVAQSLLCCLPTALAVLRRCHPARSCFKSIKYFTHPKIALGKAWIALAGPGQALKMLPPSRGADTAPENASGGADKQE